MNPGSEVTYIAFEGDRCIASGGLREVVGAVKATLDRRRDASVLIFDGSTGAPIEVDFRGSITEVLARLADGEHGVEVDMWLDQGRRQQVATGVDHLAGGGRLRARGRGNNPVPLDRKARQRGRPREAYVCDKEIKHAGSLGRCALDTEWPTP